MNMMRGTCFFSKVLLYRAHSKLTGSSNVSVNNGMRSLLRHDLFTRGHSQVARNLTPKRNPYFSVVSAAFAGLVTGWSLQKCLDGYAINFPPLTVSAAEVWNAQQDPTSARAKWNFIADVVDKAAPAVVYIEIQGRHPMTGQMTTVSNGSGFIVREDGLILTNAHVVANRQSVRVRLKDGTTHEGIVQAVDPISDLATVKIKAGNLPVLKLGNSADLRTGEWVVAMGNPFNLSNTVTAGIVSTPKRGSQELGLHNTDIEYIQTDATINFGNSGGPLVNLEGEAIGINTMKVTAGISFAIPSDHANEFLKKAGQVEKRGDSKGWFSSPKATKRRYMGITMLTLTPSLIMELKSRQEFPDVDHGVMVHKIVVGSPAYHGGLRPGDIILRINNSDVKSASDVYASVEKTEDLHITVQRGNETTQLTVIPEEVD